jgi:hypothetical protein
MTIASALYRLRGRALIGVIGLCCGSLAMAQPPSYAPANVYEVDQAGRRQSVLSLLPRDEVFQRGLAGPAILGSLRVSPAQGGEVTPDNFVPNPRFVAFLQDFLGRTAPTDPAFARAAQSQGDGWIYIIDRRTPTPMGEVPAEDILGGFEVRGGVLVEGSWRPMQSHRLLTARGLFRLDGFLAPRLLEALQRLPPPAPADR